MSPVAALAIEHANGFLHGLFGRVTVATRTSFRRVQARRTEFVSSGPLARDSTCGDVRPATAVRERDLSEAENEYLRRRPALAFDSYSRPAHSARDRRGCMSA